VAGRQLLLDSLPPLPFDLLSIGMGSVPRTAGVELDETALPIKPMQTFLQRLDQRLHELDQTSSDVPLRLAVVGAGAGGVEIAMCLPARIQQVLPRRKFELAVIDAGPLESGLLAATARTVRHVLESRSVKLLLGSPVQSATHGQVRLADGTQHAADLVLWATGAAPPPLFATFDLPKDGEGFLLRRPTLQTTADAPIFIVGDSGTDPRHPTPKAGVYAVRQGPILWGNIHRTLFNRPLLAYTPQRGFLSLLNSGDGRAILSYKGLSFHGRWCWKLKDYLDRRFLDLYQGSSEK
jgi:selenide,water dikinase